MKSNEEEAARALEVGATGGDAAEIGLEVGGRGRWAEPEK